MGKLFGTDGVRGVANIGLTPELAFRLGRAGASFLQSHSPRPRIVLGRDTRISGDMLEGAFIAGACSAGGDVLKTGIIPTPAIAYLTRKLEGHSGVMISASHNPIEDNGIKFFSHEGYKLPDEAEKEIERLVNAKDEAFPRPSGEKLGQAIELRNAEDLYADHIKMSLGCELSGMRIVLDCANGAAWRLGPRVFRELGAEVIGLNDRPDGLKINVECGSTNMTTLARVTVEEKAVLGIGFDGDADRCLAVDERGHTVDGDRIMMVFSRYYLKRDLLPSRILVATVMSNLGLEHAMEALGIRLLRAKVGDRYVLEEMKKSGATIGGEQSGHIILLEHNTTGDGIASAVLLARIMKEEGETLSGLASHMTHMPQVLVNVRAQRKDRLGEDQDVAKVIREMEESLRNRGRILVRPSGTEPLIRVMAEGPDEREVHDVVDRIAQIIEEKLG